MITTDEAAIEQLLRELVDAWNRGDAQAYGARFLRDGTLTNVNGTFFVGRDEFNRRHAEVFRGVFKGTTFALTTRRLRFLRPDVAAVDVITSLSGARALPPGAHAGPDGVIRSCLLLVLVREYDSWWIAAYHNVWQAAGG